MKQKIKLFSFVMVWLAVFILAGGIVPDVIYASTTGYTDHAHTWTAEEDCGGCKAISGKTDCTSCGHDGKVTCSYCEGAGKGYDFYCATCKATYYLSNSIPSPCPGCSSYITNSGSSYAACKYCDDGEASCIKCGGDGTIGTVCVRCNGTGTNYYCKNSQCTLENTEYKSGYKYNNWASELGTNSTAYKVCYTTENTYTVVFHGNGQTSGSTASITGCLYDDSYTLTSNGYIKNGYTFSGWNTKADGTGTSYADKAVVSKLSAVDGAAVTLYAQWKANTYTVTYDANGGAGAPEKQSFIFGSGTAVSNTIPIREGYTFVNWKAAHGDIYLNPGASIPTGWGSFTLSAQWAANSYKVTFNPCGGSLSVGSKDVIYDSSYGALPAPARAGYTFEGWYTDIFGGDRVLAADIVNILSDQVLYAHWTRDEYTVSYHGNGGTVDVSSVINYYGENVDLSVKAEKEGYIFVGWNTEPDASNGLPALTMPEGDVELYAIYSIPVSDIKEVYLMVWPEGDKDNYRTYFLSQTSDLNMKYTYILGTTDISDFLNGSTPGYAIIAFDHAGNQTTLFETEQAPSVEKHLQIVEHYKYDIHSGEWIKFAAISEEKPAGETYTPAYITPPEGYRTDSIDAAYLVQGDKVSKAFYMPVNYKLSFEPNAGKCSIEYKDIYFGDYYGELPTAERKGYEFLGWYTEPEAGVLVKSSDKYLIADNSTLYAHWQMKSYQVIYDYAENGGSGAAESRSFDYGTEIDLSVTASKTGWSFVGWNTNPDETAGLTKLIMGDKNVVLYAIYKKDITVTFIDRSDTDLVKRSETLTIYNKAAEGKIEIPELSSWNGWQILGWSLGIEGDANIDTSAGSMYVLADDTTFYGRYVKQVTLLYDTNGSPSVIKPQTKECHYNASDEYKKPLFALTDAVELFNSSFVSWRNNVSAIDYAPGDSIELLDDTVLTATWDRYPEIEAYDRYFTLEEAGSGQITEEALLKKVTGTDAEDGVLVNGVNVFVLDYNAADYTSLNADEEFCVTYKAVDSFGNEVIKTVTVTVVDTTVRVSNKVTYYRFISNRFYKDGENYVPAGEGGLEETSIWKTNPAYISLMDAVMANKKINQITRKISFYGNEKEYVIPGSGEWEHVEETWYFTKEDIAKSNDFREQYGFGSSKGTNYLEMFLEWFGHCKR